MKKFIIKAMSVGSLLAMGSLAHATDATPFDAVTSAVTDNKATLVTVLITAFGIPVTFYIYRLAKKALGGAK